MALGRVALLNVVMTQAEPGRPITAAWLAAHHVSPQLAHHYVQHGWLVRLGYGFYIRKGDRATMEKSLGVAMSGAHVGGKTALAWAGFRHNLYAGDERTLLCSHGRAKVASWLARMFPVEVRRRMLFASGDVLAVGKTTDGVAQSEPERAVLEMLSEVPSRQGLEEAEHLVEMLQGLRPEVMQSLLGDCRSVKTVRLFTKLAIKAALPVAEELDFRAIRSGSDSDYVIAMPHGTLRL